MKPLLNLQTVGLMLALIVICAILPPSPARAGLKSEALEASARFILKKFEAEVAEELGEEGGVLLGRRLEAMAAKYGERESIEAVQKVGPRAFRLVEQAGADDAARAKAVRLLVRTGDDGAWLLGRPQSAKLFARYGDDAADAMIKHRQVADGLIARHGDDAAKALKAVDGQSARRLAMMDDAGDLARIGRTPEVLGVVSRRGDRAMNFVWRNKGALATASVLTAFLANPDPFIDGTTKLAEIGGEAIVKPTVAALAKGIGQRTNWTLVLPILLAIVSAFVAFRMLLRRRRLSRA